MSTFRKLVAWLMITMIIALPTTAFAATAPNLLKLISGAVRPVISTWTLGDAANPWAEGHFTDLYAVNLSVSASTVGGVDLDGSAIIFDTDGDTNAQAAVDDVLIFDGPSNVAWQFDANSINSLHIDGATMDVNVLTNHDSGIKWGTGTAVTAGDYEIRRNNDATNRLQYNVPTGAVQEWSENGATTRMALSSSLFMNVPIANFTTINNAQIALGTTGTTVSRNIADANPVLLIDQANVGSTGNILELVNQGAAQSHFNNTGQLIFDVGSAVTGANYSIARNADATNRMQLNVPSGALIEFSHNDVATAYMSSSGLGIPAVFNESSGANAKVSFDTTGLTVERNVADANAALIADQVNAGSTGNILEMHNQSAVQSHFDIDGALVYDVASTSVAGNYESRLVGTSIRHNVPSGGTYAWGVNGAAKMLMLTDGQLRPTGVANLTSQNNAWLDLPTTGANLSRNVADGNPALIIDQVNATSTGDILELHDEGGLVLGVGQTGELIWDGATTVTGTDYVIARNADATNRMQYNVPTGAFHEFSVNDVEVARLSAGGLFVNTVANASSGANSTVALASTGTTIGRNVADANTALAIIQQNASSTGSIFTAGNDSGQVYAILQSGEVNLSPETLTSGGTDDKALNIAQTLNDSGASGGNDTYTAIKTSITGTDTTGWDNIYLLDLQMDSKSIMALDPINSSLAFNDNGVGDFQISVNPQGAGNNNAGASLTNAAGDAGSLTTGGAGGDYQIKAGDAKGSGDNNGGNIANVLGAATGAGEAGVFQIWDSSMTNAVSLLNDGTDVIVQNNVASGGFSFQDDSFAELFFFDGAGVSYSGRMLDNQGADIASANDITLGADGNYFDVTGTTTINRIATADWTAGSTFYLQFDGALTVTDNVAAGGGFGSILLTGSANYSTAAGTILQVVFDGTSFKAWPVFAE